MMLSEVMAMSAPAPYALKVGYTFGHCILVLVVTHRNRPARTMLRTGAAHCITHLLTCDLLDDPLLRLLCNLVGANRQSPVGPDEMAGIAVGILLEIILVLGFGLPEVACRNDFRNDLARPQA